MKTVIFSLLLSLWLWLGGASAALAHAVQTDYFVDLFAARVEVAFTASFSTGEPMAEATVLVYAPGETETPWQEGQTDEAGQFVFAPNASLVGDWRIEFKQGGHEDIRIVPVDENGINYSLISHGGSRDQHFYVHGLENRDLRKAMGLFSAVSIGGIALVVQRRLLRLK